MQMLLLKLLSNFTDRNDTFLDLSNTEKLNKLDIHVNSYY